MKIEDIKDRARRSAQTPFLIRLTDGQAFMVKHPEFLGFPRDEGSFVYFPESGGIQIIALNQLVTLDVMPQAAGQ